jgi:hypothetical protein
MIGNRKLNIVMTLFSVVLLCCASVAQATVPEEISYQGQLTDAVGAPLEGTYDVWFYLYDAPSGGILLWDEQQSVVVTDGIYNVQLGAVSPLEVTVFSGNTVYLEVVIYNPATTTWETLSPRQQLTSTAYAFLAENAQSLEGYGSADFAPALHEHSGDDITSGIIDEAYMDPDIARDAEITWGNLSGIPADIADGDQVGITAETDPTVDSSVKDGVSWGELSGIPAGFADGVDNDSGGDITAVTAGTGLTGGGSSGAVNLAVAVPLSLTDDIASGGIISCENTNATGFGGFFEASGESGRGVSGRATGAYGQGVLGFAMGQFGRGVYGWATGTSGEGIRGYATGASGRGAYGFATGTYGWGVFGEASGTYGYGVYGHATNTGDVYNYGGYFEAKGTYGRGVYGYASASSGTNYGVYGLSNSISGSGVYGEATATSSGTTYGVYGRSDSTDGYGIYGYATASSGMTRGVYARCNSTHGTGVLGSASAATGPTTGVLGASASTSGSGVYGYASASSGETYGVRGESDSPDGRGVYGQATASSGYTYGVQGVNDSDYGSGVYGYATADSGYASGVYGRSASTNGRGVYGSAPIYGVYGTASAESGTTFGVYGWSGSDSGRGVYGTAIAMSGTTSGVYGVSYSTSGRGVYGEAVASATSGTNYGVYGRSNSTSGYDFYAGGAGNNYGPFTGAHEAKLPPDFPGEVEPGLIVAATGTAQKRHNSDGSVNLSSTLPTVKLADRANDKAVFGVLVSETTLPEDHWYEAAEGERFASVNALGEGRVWVSNSNGAIEAGDYITTSAIPGYGQKQHDDLLHSYTLGKAIETVDWEQVTEMVEIDGMTYKVYLIAVVYTSG